MLFNIYILPILYNTVISKIVYGIMACNSDNLSKEMAYNSDTVTQFMIM